MRTPTGTSYASDRRFGGRARLAFEAKRTTAACTSFVDGDARERTTRFRPSRLNGAAEGLVLQSRYVGFASRLHEWEDSEQGSLSTSVCIEDATSHRKRFWRLTT